MVSFTDHYNAISIDRLPSQTEIGKVSWYYDNSLLCKAKFSELQILFSLKKTHSSASEWWEYTQPCFKENGKIFSKNSTTQENITIL